jgi:tetratricopeptide (TPR) repeat protein
LPRANKQLPIKTVAICLLIAAAAFIAYIPAIDNGFMRSWDDGVFVTGNQELKKPDALGRIWTTLDMPKGYPNYPLVFTLLRAEFVAFGLEPAPYHVTNILLHAMNAALVFLVLLSLKASRWLSAAVALLFALHPMQVESVAWITELKIVLFTLFFLAAFLAYRRFREKGSKAAYAACLILFVCALLSKTTAITLVASLFLADRILDGRRRLRDMLPLAPMALIGAAAVYMTTLVEYAEVSRAVAVAYRPFLVARTLWFYAGKLLWPHPVMAVYERWPGLRPYLPGEAEYLSQGFYIAFGALVAAALALLFLRRRIPPLSMWGLGHFVVTLMPILGVVHFAYQTHSFVADRYVYVAAVGLFLAIGALLVRVPARAAVTAAMIVLLAVLSVMTWNYAGAWKNASTLWGHTLRYNDGSHAAHNSIGMVYLNEGRVEQAISHFERALEIKPDKFKSLNNLGMAYAARKQYRTAAAIFRRALELRPDYAKAHFNLGTTYLRLGQRELAVHHYRQALRFDPGYEKARRQLERIGGPA